MIHWRVEYFNKGRSIMENTSIDKRKHFRFPAFDDEEGVKIQSEHRRVLFQDEFDDENNTDSSLNYFEEPTYEQRYLNRQNSRNDTVGKKKNAIKKNINESGNVGKNDWSVKKPAFSKPPIGALLKTHKTILKDPKNPEKSQTGLFGIQGKHYQEAPGSDRQAVFSGRSSFNSSPSAFSQNTSRGATLLDKQAKKNDFVPKYIPASTIPDENDNEVSREALVESMGKMSDSFLTFSFEEESTAFQAKKNEQEPTVQAFKGTVHEQDITVSRRQFQKKKAEVGLFETKEEEVALQSRQELRNTRAKKKNQPAYLQKKQMEEGKIKKHSPRLEKTLAGIFEENQVHLEGNSYFEKE